MNTLHCHSSESSNEDTIPYKYRFKLYMHLKLYVYPEKICDWSSLAERPQLPAAALNDKAGRPSRSLSVSMIGSHHRGHTDGAYYPEAHHGTADARALTALRPELCRFAASHHRNTIPAATDHTHNGPPGRELRARCFLHCRLEETGEQQASCYGARCDQTKNNRADMD